jgi:AcrR family transcriptional regulator
MNFSSSIADSASPASRYLVPEGETRFDKTLARILECATQVFYEKGYEGASMRDLSRATGMSLSGLYHYFQNKEELLYLIQRHTFSTILELLRGRLHDCDDTEQCIRIFILNHLEYFLANRMAMTVLSHEDDVLDGVFGTEIAALKREYYRICVGLLDAYRSEGGRAFDSRVAVLSLFGMINWIYTWYNPRSDAKAADLARQMGDIFLGGIGSAVTNAGKRNCSKSKRV